MSISVTYFLCHLEQVMTSFSVLQRPSLSRHCLRAPGSFNCGRAECPPCLRSQQDPACGLRSETLLVAQGNWEVVHRKTVENTRYNLNKTLRNFSRSVADHVLVSKAERRPPAACAGPGGASPEVSRPWWWSVGSNILMRSRVLRMAPSPAELGSVSSYFTPTANRSYSGNFTSWKGSAVNFEMLKCDGENVYEEADKTLT